MGKNTQFTLFLFICSIYCFYSMCIRYGLISFIEITASLLTLLPIHFKQMERHLSSRINENQLSTPTTICWHICFRLIYNSIKWHRWHQSTNNILNNRRHFFVYGAVRAHLYGLCWIIYTGTILSWNSCSAPSIPAQNP